MEALQSIKKGRLTASRLQYIINIKKGAAGRRSAPFECAEITASLCEGGGYFFFVASNTRATTPRITRQNWNSSAYVTISITPFLQGGPTACNRMWQHLVLILPWRCFPVKKKALDSARIAGYNKDKERCYRQTVSPSKLTEITASLC